MKFSKGMLVLVSGVALAGVASAQDQAAVSAEKKAAIQNLIPGAYGSLEVRHATRRIMDGDKVDNEIPSLTVRPTLGAAFYDGKLDTSFTWIFSKKPDSTRINKAVLYNETVIKAVEGSLGYAGPYAYTEQKDGNSFDFTQVGGYAELGHEVEIVGGKLALSAYTNPTALYRSAKTADDEGNKDAVAVKEAGLSLTEEEATIERRDPEFNNATGIGAKVKPAAVAGLSVGVAVDMLQRWAPKYEAETVDGDLRYSLSGYERTAAMINKFSVGYKLTDKVSLTNQLRQNIGGYYENGIDVAHADRTGNLGTTRWENRVVLSATLF